MEKWNERESISRDFHCLRSYVLLLSDMVKLVSICYWERLVIVVDVKRLLLFFYTLM